MRPSSGVRAPLATLPGSRGGTARGGWYPFTIHESFTGAWQRNLDQPVDSVLAAPMVFICVTKIMQDIGKVRLRLVELTADGVWVETESAAFSPVLRRPNPYQNRIKFIEHWIASKLLHGNTYVLKSRDVRGVVIALYILDPTRVTPLVSPSGSVYYELRRDDLSGLGPAVTDGADTVIVPGSEIIHDVMYALFHPLIGVSPIFACGVTALQQLAISGGSREFFANGARPGGILTAPGAIGDDTAARLKAYWDAEFSGVNAGKVAVLGDGLKYEGMTMTAVDAQLIDQLQWSGTTICGTFGMPPYLAGIGPAPNFGVSQILQLYYNECLQPLFTSMEVSLDEGLELPRPFGTEFDIDDLILLDHEARTKAAAEGIKGGGMSPDEARRRYFNLGKVEGGSTPYLQQQNFSLAALAERDANHPFAKTTPAAPADPAVTAFEERAALMRDVAVKLQQKGIHAVR